MANGSAAMQAVSLAAAFAGVVEHWSPRVVGQVNGQYVKVAKVQGELCWHKHDDEDELFQVVRGRLVIQMEAGEVSIGAGEFYVVPKGVMHNPVAVEECWIVLIEPVGTTHTGDVVMERTRSVAEQLG